MRKFYDTSNKENRECEICWANNEDRHDSFTFNMHWIDPHCIELRRNREARKHKNVKVKETVF